MIREILLVLALILFIGATIVVWLLISCAQITREKGKDNKVNFLMTNYEGRTIRYPTEMPDRERLTWWQEVLECIRSVLYWRS